MFSDLTAIRKERIRAQQVAIRRITKAGVPSKMVTVHVYPREVEAKIAYLEKLNPGSKYVAG